uniref:Transmembrane 9 superfamily member n=1 Tax=Nicotiana sylvestris TaxID=4096 RepID=A0A1U7XBH2_NICSY|nr:PREDICTED: putative phagocytic receptor 1a [Nicotiana sylvestris]
MILDNLPVAVPRRKMDGSGEKVYERGFQVGFKGRFAGRKEKSYFMNNHLNFKVMYHEDLETGTARVVGFEVIPLSINHGYKKWDEQNTKLTTCKPGKPTVFRTNSVPQEIVADNKVVFTYDVSFEESKFSECPLSQ